MITVVSASQYPEHGDTLRAQNQYCTLWFLVLFWTPKTWDKLSSNFMASGEERPSYTNAYKRFDRKFVSSLLFICRNHGCNISHCVLCKHNPNKRCTGNFAHKYWVGDRLLAKCEGDIQVELIDTSGARVTEDLSEYRIEVPHPSPFPAIYISIQEKISEVLYTRKENSSSQDNRIYIKRHGIRTESSQLSYVREDILIDHWDHHLIEV